MRSVGIIMKEMNKLKFRTKNELVYEEIRRLIVLGTFEPEERLFIKYLAKDLGVSESPIREALKRLISENFVVEKGINLYVAPLSAMQFVDMLDIRLKLELIAIRQSARHIQETDVENLRLEIEEMKEELVRDDLATYSILHRNFHRSCFALCNIPYLISALTEASDHHERGVNIFKLKPWRKSPDLGQHEKIVNMLAAHDIEGAAREWEDNRKKAFNFYSEQLKNKGVM